MSRIRWIWPKRRGTRSEVAAGDARDGGDGFGVGEVFGGQREEALPVVGEHEAQFVAAERPVVVGEADSAVELRVARQARFEAGHADQDQAEGAAVEDVAQLLEGGRLRRSASSTMSRSTCHAASVKTTCCLPGSRWWSTIALKRWHSSGTRVSSRRAVTVTVGGRSSSAPLAVSLKTRAQPAAARGIVLERELLLARGHPGVAEQRRHASQRLRPSDEPRAETLIADTRFGHRPSAGVAFGAACRRNGRF